MSFRKYVMSYVDNDCGRGDIARDLKDDPCCKGLSSYTSILKHITTHHRPCDAVLELLKEMYEDFKRM